MREKIVLVGLDNPQSRDPRHALWPSDDNCAGGRLCSYMDLGKLEYIRLFERDNLFPTGKGRSYASPERDWAAMQTILRHWKNGERVLFVCLGKLVAEAFGCADEWFVYKEVSFMIRESGEVVKYECVAVPHPSGRNLWWNTYRDNPKAKRAMYAIVRRARLAREARGERQDEEV